MSKFRTWTGAVLSLVLGLAVLDDVTTSRRAHAAPVGQGFTLNTSDLRFILKQIKIAEAHATREGPNGEAVPGQPLLGTGPHQIASPLLPYGLRAVDGSENNLVADQHHIGAAQRMLRASGALPHYAVGPNVLRGAPRHPVARRDDERQLCARRPGSASDPQPPSADTKEGPASLWTPAPDFANRCSLISRTGAR
jgi:hypothetical protein